MSKNKTRMVLSLAHPDDESFGMAGTIARYVNEGTEVYLICATKGDVGEVDPEYLNGHTDVADLRMEELRCAARTLGLAHVYELGYRDSGMSGSPANQHPNSLIAADLDEVARQITEIIREVRPHVVVTFDPHGGYGHPDHIAMHKATTRAFEAAPDPTQYPEQIKAGLRPYQPQKLYYMTFDRRWMKVVLLLLPLLGQDPERMGRNKDINFREIASHQYPIHARIATDEYAEIADLARQCHASQLGGIGPRRVTQALGRLIFGMRDTYMRVYPPVNGKRLRENDLFEGIQPD